MRLDNRWWTYLVVTVVAVLIWSWAADETREQGSTSIRLRFVPSDPARGVVTPTELSVQVELDGSRSALHSARTLDMPLILTVGNELPSEVGTHTVNLVEALHKHQRLRRTRASVISADPSSVPIDVDTLVELTIPIQPELPSLETEGEIVVEPPQATVKLPSRLRGPPGEELAIEAYIDQSRLDRLEPGRAYTLNAALRPPQRLRSQPSVIIDPPTVTVAFTVRSRIAETTLPMVRVQIAGPPEDHGEYAVEIDEKDKQLTDITIKADGALIRQIEQGDATVVALVHLSSSEKERRVESKPVTCFLALRRDGAATIVDAEIASSKQMPLIRLRITERSGS